MLGLWATRDQLREQRRELEKVVHILSSVNNAQERKVVPIDRRSGLSFQEFVQEYELKDKPVIITDLGELITKGKKLDVDYFRVRPRPPSSLSFRPFLLLCFLGELQGPTSCTHDAGPCLLYLGSSSAPHLRDDPQRVYLKVLKSRDLC